VPVTLQFLWALTGLLLTIGSTFLQPALVVPLLNQSNRLIIEPISVTMQIGAVLLTGCMGGRNAAFLSQLSYVLLGLSGFSVFYQGGGLGYLKLPSFGYLLGFIAGGWVCGLFAFARPSQGWLATFPINSIERITISCLMGLITIHSVGIIYLLASQFGNWSVIQQALWQYSVQMLPGQLFVICATVVTSFLLRRVLLYRG
jgi:biotin transport system substrate-specific component